MKNDPMKPQVQPPLFFETLIRRNRTTWSWAVAGALGLNLILFAGMPHLLHPVPQKTEFEQIVSQVNVFRLQPPDTPVKHKMEKPPEPPPELKRPKPPSRQPLPTKLTLPFDINPRLPAGPGTLALPPLAPAALDPTGFDGAFSVGELDSPLTELTRIPPVYPMQARHRGIEGWVRVRFVVDEDGRVARVSVVESQPSGIFDQSVIRCVSGWRFKAGTVDGTPVKTLAETTIRFKLD